MIIILLPILLSSFLSVGYSQTVSDTSIISMSGADWSLKVDSALASSIDSRNTPYMTAKSSTEKELFLELATLEDCKSGVVQFKVDMAGLTAYKQLPLTEQEIAEGSFRPKNVENSFALFNSDGRKVAHIYGSKITDSKGVEVWLDQDLSEGLLTVYLPKPEELATLTFPLLLDPTFGYTTAGASWQNLDGNTYANTYLGAEGTLTQISAYCNVTAPSKTLYLGLYNDTASLPSNRLTVGNQTISNTSPEWINITVSYALEASNYWLSASSASGIEIAFDTGVTTPVSWSINPDPFVVDYNSSNTKLSIYGSYDITPTPTPTPEGATATPFPEGEMTDTDWYISIFVLALIVINILLMMLPFALVRFVFGILSLFLCMLALSYQIPLSPYLQTAGLLISALAMLFSVRARE